MTATYARMKQLLEAGLEDLMILCGDNPNTHPDMEHHDIAQLAASNFRELAGELEQAGKGFHESMMCYPSPIEWADKQEEIEEELNG